MVGNHVVAARDRASRAPSVGRASTFQLGNCSSETPSAIAAGSRSVSPHPFNVGDGAPKVCLGPNTPKIARDTRKRGERCHRMNVKIAKFNPNQIATTAMTICIDFVPRRVTRVPRLGSQQNLSATLCTKCGSHLREATLLRPQIGHDALYLAAPSPNS